MTRSRFARLHDEKVPYPPPPGLSRLEKEIQSWEGFPWALRKEDVELWNAIIKEVRERFGEAVEESGKDFTTEAFFMVLLLAQHRMIRRLQSELKTLGVEVPEVTATTQPKLDWYSLPC